MLQLILFNFFFFEQGAKFLLREAEGGYSRLGTTGAEQCTRHASSKILQRYLPNRIVFLCFHCAIRHWRSCCWWQPGLWTAQQCAGHQWDSTVRPYSQSPAASAPSQCSLLCCWWELYHRGLPVSSIRKSSTSYPSTSLWRVFASNTLLHVFWEVFIQKCKNRRGVIFSVQSVQKCKNRREVIFSVQSGLLRFPVLSSSLESPQSSFITDEFHR